MRNLKKLFKRSDKHSQKECSDAPSTLGVKDDNPNVQDEGATAECKNPTGNLFFYSLGW